MPKSASLPVLLGLCCVTAFSQPPGQAERGDIAGWITQGNQHREVGNLSAAIEDYKHAQGLAAAAKLPDAEGDAWMRVADAYDDLAIPEGPTSRPAYLLSAAAAYRRAIGLGLSPELDAVAKNNCAFVYIHLGEREEAARLFAAIVFNKLEAASRARYRTNYADSERAAGRLDAAFNNYVLAVRALPSFERASAGAFGLIDRAEGRVWSRHAAEILDVLVQNYQTDLAERYAFDYLLSGTRGNAEFVMDSLLRAWAATPPVPPRVSKNDQVGKKLENLELVKDRYESAQPVTSALAGELIGIFDAKWTVPFSVHEAARPLKYWSGRMAARTALIALLRSSARSFAQPPAAITGADKTAFDVEAFARYMTAWYLNSSDTQSALSAAALIDRNRTLDPNGYFGRQMSGYYVGESPQDIVRRAFFDTDPGRRNLQLSSADLVNIALMHIFLVEDLGVSELNRARDALDRRAARGGGASVAGIYESLGKEFLQKDLRANAARMYWSAAASFQEGADTENAIASVSSALSVNPIQRQRGRLFPPAEGKNEFLVFSPGSANLTGSEWTVRIGRDGVANSVEPTSVPRLYLGRLKSPVSGPGKLSVAPAGSPAELSADILTPRQGTYGRQVGESIKLNPPLAGDRFVSGDLPVNTQRIVFHIYERLKVPESEAVSDDYFSQSAIAFIDSANSSFFAPLQAPLHLSQHVLARADLSSGEPPKEEHFDVLHTPLLARYGVFLTGGGFVSLSGGNVRSGGAVSINGEFSIRSWLPEAAWPISGVLKQVAHAQFHSFRWGVRVFGGYSNTAVVTSASRSDSGLAIIPVRQLEAGAYAPLMFNNLSWRYWNHVYVPFISPIVGLRARPDSAPGGNLYPEFGFRCGVLRSPMTLRRVEPELGSHFDLIQTKGDSFRSLREDSSTQRSQYQWQFKAEVPLYPSPLLAGFSTAIGPWPRDTRFFLGLKFDVLSMVRLVKGPAPRTF